jgi:hypothetical protein
MYEGPARPRVPTEYRRAPARRSIFGERPDRVALWAFVMAVVMMVAAAANAHAGSGGTSATSTTSGGSKYSRLWDGISRKNKRWARRTSECESGGNAKAVSSGGTYRGAFQFTLYTWRHAPKSPGGDPVNYPWRTQAVVAVYLKKQEGTGAWPVCG